MSSNQSYSSSPPSPALQRPPQQPVSFAEEAEAEGRLQTRYSSEDTGKLRLVVTDVARVTNLPHSHPTLQRVSEDGMNRIALESNPQLDAKDDGGAEDRGARFPHLSVHCTHLNGYAPEAAIPASMTSAAVAKQPTDSGEVSAFHHPPGFDIGVSPPVPSQNLSHKHSVIATSTNVTKMDCCLQEDRSNVYSASERETGWSSSPQPLSMILLATPTNSSTSAENPLSVDAVTQSRQATRLKALSRLKLDSSRAPTTTTRPTRTHRVNPNEWQGSSSPIGDCEAFVEAKLSVATSHAFPNASPGDVHAAESNMPALELTEFSASSTLLPLLEHSLSSRTAFNLPTQLPSPQSALPQTQVSLAGGCAAMNSAAGTPLSLSSSVVMATPSLPLSPLPFGNILQLRCPSHDQQQGNCKVGQHGSTSAASDQLEALHAIVSASPEYRTLSPTHARRASTSAVPVKTSGEVRSHAEACRPGSLRTMAQEWALPTASPTPQQQWPLSLLHAGGDGKRPHRYRQDFLPNAVRAFLRSFKAGRFASCGVMEPELQAVAGGSTATLPFSPPAPSHPPINSTFSANPGESPPRMTLQNYVKQMSSPAANSRSFSTALILIGVGFCAVPLCCCLLLLSLHFWAVDMQERSCLDSQHRPHVGSMLQTSFTLLLGVVLCVVVMGLGGGFAVYALPYRRGIRYQRRALTLCARLSYSLVSSEQLNSEERQHGISADDPRQVVLSAIVMEDEYSPPFNLNSSSSTVFRWHREIASLLDAWKAPLEAFDEMSAFLTAPPSYSLSVLLPSPQPRESVERPLANAVTASGALTRGGVTSRTLPMTNEVDSIGSGQQDPQGDRAEEVVLSRRPRHPADESRLHDVVTVVVCRFLVPPSLLVGLHPLSRVQLTELEQLSLEFHARLRRAAHGRQVYLTECGLSEVVFSLNTVWPVQPLVANATAVALALAAQKELTEWSPTHKDQRVPWGVAVHRFRAVLRPVCVDNGRLALGFGTLEYNVARTLAQLSALCGYGVLCHTDFFTYAMNEAKGLPVDYVMDRMQRQLLVYQLHDENVPEESKRSMADVLSLLRSGRYTEACQHLKAWKKHVEDGASFPSAAQHLLYVSHFLAKALGHGDHDRVFSAYASDIPSLSSSCQLPAAAATLLHGFSEWSTMMLLQSYCRPPPVWEEDAHSVSEAPPLHLSLSSSESTTTVSESNSDHAWPSPLLPCNMTNAADALNGNKNSDNDGSGGGGAAAPAVLLPRVSHNLLLSELSKPTDAKDDRHEQINLRCTLLGDCTPTWSSGTHLVPSLLTVDSSAREDSNSLSRVASRSALSGQRSVRLIPSEQLPPVAVSTLSAGGRFSGVAVTAPAALPQTLPEAERRVCGHRHLHAVDAPHPSQKAASPICNPLFPKVETVGESSTNSLTLPLPLDCTRVQQTTFAVPSVPLPGGASSSLTPESGITDEVGELPAFPSARSSGSRHPRLQSNIDGKGNRPRGRSVSVVCDDELDEAELSGADAGVPHSFKFSEYLRGATDDANGVPNLAQAAQSLTLSGCMPCRSTPCPTTFPLFSESALTLPGIGEDVDDCSDSEDTDTSGADTDMAGFAEVTRERSVMSVMQRSRSTMSFRAASTLTAVVCTRTRCISCDLSGMTQVFQGFHPHGYLVAIKQVDKRSLKLVQLQRKEIHLLHRLSHPNIVHFIGDWEDSAAVYMTLEYSSDTLTSVLKKFGRLLPGVVRHYVRGLLSALAYLHRKGIVHRDVSPNNVIITSASNSSEAKLIDFGRCVLLPRSCRDTVNPAAATMASVIASSQGLSNIRSARHNDSPMHHQFRAPVVGTPMFMSPQACQGLVHPANDVWGVGVIMYLCLTGEYPYPTDTFTDPKTFIAGVGSGEHKPVLGALPDSASKEKDFIEQCLKADSAERPSAAALLNHPFIVV
ncbi:putative protein kinase [Leptomonas seymouri]|uniref:Protein kinase domain-containing protein n=1 Tax=Leptomonas seymouri TaxID=5684 RepID=A0A0N1I4B1_LEPSE|nr:putative protein kinase [Leptomonas seymouri]|eukprot:KPI86088.1 putative protein kinase [Leptomonas seymouri]